MGCSAHGPSKFGLVYSLCVWVWVRMCVGELCVSVSVCARACVCARVCVGRLQTRARFAHEHTRTHTPTHMSLRSNQLPTHTDTHTHSTYTHTLRTHTQSHTHTRTHTHTHFPYLQCGSASVHMYQWPSYCTMLLSRYLCSPFTSVLVSCHLVGKVSASSCALGDKCVRGCVGVCVGGWVFARARARACVCVCVFVCVCVAMHALRLY